MCGIVGYIGKRQIGLEVVLAGLRALEYRGYDSAGVAYIDKGTTAVEKQIGRVDSLAAALGGTIPLSSTAIGHTRWATHGRPSSANAHPHFNQDRTITVVHNGIIENYAELKEKLQKLGYSFTSETDTEVIPHLLDYYAKTAKTFEAAFQQMLTQLQGAYGLLVMTTAEPDKLFTARLGSPLVLGIIPKSGVIVASDPAAVQAYTKEVVFLNDLEYAVVERDGAYRLHDLKAAKHVHRDTETLDYDASEPRLGEFPHFMLKEIFEAPQTIQAATLGRIKPDSNEVKLGGLEDVKEQLRYIDRIVVVACGTSYYAALVGEYLIEEIAGIPVEVQLSSEFKYRNEPFSRSTALIAVSQSGETADTIAAIKKVENYGVLRLGIVNAVGSTIARITDAGVYCHAGPERAVASTKAFTAQVTVFALLALYLSNGNTPLYKPLIHELLALPGKTADVLKQSEAIKKTALKYENFRDFLYIGRGYGYPCSLEGALKVKEISYVHAEGYAAGEMKHGPLAMIDPDFPTFAVATKSELLDKTFSNIEEIRARRGPVVAVGTAGHTAELKKLADDVIEIPETLDQLSPLLVAIVLHLFAYHIATAKGYDVDHPRNLAKSVTVE
jgi:glucosamine--fructose-6-phosphate aminotransferase (isomerizing)